MENSGRVIQISVNPQGGVPKHRVAEAQLLSGGVAGDKQRQLKFHGGPQRAVCVYSYELIRDLQEEGHPIEPGTTGENLTLSGIDWTQMRPGAQLQVGEALLEVASYTAPCNNIAASFVDGDFMRISQKTNAGWSRVYARVLNEALVREGDAAQLITQKETA
ncbi:MAG TPA: MOSC domain-containing protein [Abditibacteriaceae bacterium]|jgi:MOSC domain-containing protein YiiM